MHRAHKSGAERAYRSRLAQWMTKREMIRGTLTVRKQVCGKAGCRCTRGEKHVSLCLVRSRGGTIEQMHIPRAYEKQVREWVKQYKDTKALLEKLSDLQWEKLRKGQRG